MQRLALEVSFLFVAYPTFQNVFCPGTGISMSIVASPSFTENQWGAFFS